MIKSMIIYLQLLIFMLRLIKGENSMSLRIKKGDIVIYNPSNNIINVNNNLYIVMSVNLIKNTAILSKMSFSDNGNKMKKYYCQIEDGTNIIRVNCKSVLFIDLSKEINKIKMHDVQLVNSLDAVQYIYDMRAKFKEEIYLERIAKKKNRKNRKKEKRAMINAVQVGKSGTTFKKYKGMKDPTYKGTINIVRG